VREERRVSGDHDDDRAGAFRRSLGERHCAARADVVAGDRQARTTAVVRLNEDTHGVLARAARGGADAALEAVADHPGAGADAALRDRAVLRVRECREDVFARHVHALDVVEEAVVRLADDRERPRAPTRGR
jgi:hypothetical protein